jgi:hypothetical protein
MLYYVVIMALEHVRCLSPNKNSAACEICDNGIKMKKTLYCKTCTAKIKERNK